MKKIFFSASIQAMPQLIENYKLIEQEIFKNNAEIIDNWLNGWEELINKYRKKGKTSIKKEDILKKIDNNIFFENYIKKIKNCDAIIVEVSRPSIAVGYQIFFAATHKKPILALFLKGASKKEDIKNIIPLNSPYITLRKYSSKTLPYIIKTFLGKNNAILKKFNFIISEEIENYIKWLNSITPDKSKSELLREKIEREIIFNDDNYLEYLKN